MNKSDTFGQKSEMARLIVRTIRLAYPFGLALVLFVFLQDETAHWFQHELR